MIQELLGGSATPKGLLSEGKTSSNPFSSPLLTTNTSICTTTMMTPSNNSGGANNSNNNNNSNSNSNSNGNNSETNNSNQQNLRCPRCDSTNTKFCYYNNYNLTQPRHFCKTCRRYWTKGGTLRNVPIGGGCRKNKSTISSNQSSSAMSKCSTPNNFMAKTTKATFSSEMLANDNTLFLGNGFLDHSIHSPGPNSLPWSSSLPQSQNSHILALLRGSTPFSNPNPNNNPNPSSLGLDLYGNGAPSLLGSFTRGNQQHLNGFGQDYVENNNGINGGSNILDLYQKLKSSTNYGYCASNENPVILGHMVGSTPSSSSPMNTSSFDAASFGGGGGGGDHLGSYGFMGSTPGISSWSDFPAVPINGAYP